MNKEGQKQQVKIRYGETTAQYAAQFVLNTTNDDVIINFSSGAITDPTSEEALLPIHTRIAMTKDAARRLHAVLGSVIAEGNEIPSAALSQLPKIPH